jgi:tetratricopeptide (TPR) repeat protein
MAQVDWTPEELYLLTERGYAFYQQGCYEEAGIIFEGVTAADPSNSYARTALAAVCLVLGDAQRAVDELSFLLRQNPADEDARARRCEAYCQLGNWTEAGNDLAILRRNGSGHHVQRLAWRLETSQLPGRSARLLNLPAQG